MNKELIRSWLNTTDLPITVISRKLNISRNTLYAWRKGEGEIRYNNYKRFLEVFGHQLNNKEGRVYEKVQSEREEIDSKYVMRLQKNEIDRLEQENKQLREATNSVQSKAWDDIQYDFYSDVRVKLIPFKRVVHSMKGHGLDELAESLEVNKTKLLEDYFSVGNWHDFNNHPVNAIIEPKTLGQLQEMSVKFPSIMESLKLLVGEHYFQQIIVYRNKNNVVNSLCSIKIHWIENPHRAECKTQIIKIR